MMTSGLVVKLQPDSPAGVSALTSIRSMPSFTVGNQEECWLSVALEADNGVESEQWHDWLRSLPGVADVEVVFVHSDDAEVADVDA